MDAQCEALKSRLAGLVERAKEIQATADQHARDLSATESAEVDTIFETCGALELQIQSRERIAGLTGVSGRRTEPSQPGVMGARRPSLGGGSLRGNRATELFGAAPSLPPGRLPFANLGHAISAALRDPGDPALRAMNAAAGMNESGDAGDGGWLIPPQWSDALLDESLAFESIRPYANVVPMSSSSLALPRWDDFTRTGNTTAGLTLKWIDEGGTLVPQKGKVLPMYFKAKKCALMVVITSELMEDAAAFGRQLNTKMVEAVAQGLDAAFISGTGAGAPLGILKSPALLTVAKTLNQTNGTISEANIVAMQAALHPRLWRESAWLASPSALAQLLLLSQTPGPTQDSVRTASYLLSQSADGELRLLGRRVLVTDACPALGQVGDLILAALPRYTIAMRRDTRIETSIAAYFSTDELGVRLTLRLDGMPEWQSPVTLADGTSKLSSFVTLEKRSS